MAIQGGAVILPYAIATLCISITLFADWILTRTTIAERGPRMTEPLLSTRPA